MKLKLVESAKPISKLERNINNKLLPALEDMGYEIDLARTLKEKFCHTYFGNYTDYKGLEIPFELELNTTSPKIDGNYQMFATIKLGGESIPLGACDSNDARDFQDLIDASIPNPTVYSAEWNGDHSEEQIPSQNGKESHTAAEWRKLFKDNQKKMDAGQFGTWWNNVFPTKL